MSRLLPILSPVLEGLILWATGLVFFHPLPHQRYYPEKTLLMLLPAIALGFGALSAPLGARQVFLMAVAGLLYQFAHGVICYRTGKSVIFYCGIWAMQTYALVFELCRFAGYSSLPVLSSRQEIQLLMRLIVAAAVCGTVGYTVSIWLPVYQQQHAGPRQNVSALMLYVIFAALICGFYHNGVFRFQGLMDLILFMAQLYCLIVLYLQAALFQKSAIRQERDMIQLLWRQQKAQYQQSKESIAIINQKTHDLKHQLAAMRTMESSDQRERYIQEIQQSVNIYDSMVKTGNETLDIVLTEKSLFCKAHNITVTCVADGAKLGFMDPVDVYTMMGNAMDNAIEAVQRFEQKELRTIDVVIYARQSLLVISVTNPLQEELVVEDGIPRSTKPQDGYHGFGVRSMRTTARKYGGELSVDTRDGCFSLNIVFPLENQ